MPVGWGVQKGRASPGDPQLTPVLEGDEHRLRVGVLVGGLQAPKVLVERADDPTCTAKIHGVGVTARP